MSYGEGEMLAKWLALELRRTRTQFDQSRKEQDLEFQALGIKRSGARVKRILESASDISVKLADDTINKAIEYSSTPEQLDAAEKAVSKFTKEIAFTSLQMAHFVSSGNGIGNSVVQTAHKLALQLVADIEDAFFLAKNSNQYSKASSSNRSKVGRPPNHDWSKIKEFALSAIKERPDISRSQLADSLVSEYAEKVGAPSPVKRTIERELKKWGLPKT